MLRCFTTLAAVALALAGCGDNRTGGAAQLAIDPEAATVAIGRDLVLVATYLDDDGLPATGDRLTWATSNADVATVTPTADGAIVRGVHLGPAVITAGVGELDDATLVTVRAAEVSGLALDPPMPSVPIGTCAVVFARVTTTDGQVRPIEGFNVQWSGTTGVLSVGGDGTICPIAFGHDTLRAVFGGQLAEAPVEVTAAIRTVLQLQGLFGLALGGSAQAQAFVFLSDNTVEDVTDDVTWSSDAPAIVTASASGLMTATGIGTTTIRATLGALSASQRLQVFDAAPIALTVTPDHPTVPMGTFRQLTAQLELTDHTMPDVTSSASWWSGSPTVATVSANGLVTGVAPGASVVTADFQGIRGAVLVTVPE